VRHLPPSPHSCPSRRCHGRSATAPSPAPTHPGCPSPGSTPTCHHLHLRQPQTIHEVEPVAAAGVQPLQQHRDVIVAVGTVGPWHAVQHLRHPTQIERHAVHSLPPLGPCTSPGFDSGRHSNRHRKVIKLMEKHQEELLRYLVASSEGGRNDRRRRMSSSGWCG
jgi:hypothetical protein